MPSRDWAVSYFAVGGWGWPAGSGLATIAEVPGPSLASPEGASRSRSMRSSTGV
jgi:hypothetical protein